MVYNLPEGVSGMLKKLFFIIVCIIAVVAIHRSGILRREPMTFDRIARQFLRDGLTVTNRTSSTFKPAGAVEGEEMKVAGMTVRVWRFENTGRLSVEYENYKPDAGAAIAERMGVTTQLGLQTRPARGSKTYPAKKGMYLLVVSSNDSAAAGRVIESFKRL